MSDPLASTRRMQAQTGARQAIIDKVWNPMALAGDGCRRILIVEDDFFIREDIAEHMRQAGHEVTTAASGEAALKKLDAEDGFDVLFTDISLGGAADGWAVAVEFRRANPEIAVIYASANQHDPAKSVGQSRFFSKPYDARAVEGACRSLSGRP